MDIGNIVNYVSIGLTVLFFLILTMNVLVGFCRGFKSSLKHLETMTLALLSTLGLYFSLRDGGWVFQLVKNYLPNYKDESGASEYIINYLINTMPDIKDGIALEYVMQLKPLTEGVVNILMLILTSLFYFLFLMLYNSIYWFIRSERKKKKDDSYKNYRLAGAGVYLVRGLLTSFLVFSLIGTLIYMTSGGKSHVERSREELNDANLLDMHHLYSELNEKGIMGFFGLIKNSDNEPFYFFLTDLLIKTKTKDIDSDNLIDVYPRLEFASISRLAFDIWDLGQKYKLFQQDDTTQALSVFEEDAFEKDLNAIVDNYKETEYLNNFIKLTYNNVKKMVEKQRDEVSEDYVFYQNDQEKFRDSESATFKEAELKFLASKEYDKTLPYKVKQGKEIKQLYDDLLDIFWPKTAEHKITPIEIFNISELKLLIKASSSSVKSIIELAKTMGEMSEIDLIDSVVNIVSDLDKNIQKLTLFNEKGEKSKAVNAMYERALKFTYKTFNLDIEFEDTKNLNYIQDFNSILGTVKDLGVMYKEYKQEIDKNGGDAIAAVETILEEVGGEKSSAELAYDNIIKKFNTSPTVNTFLSSTYFQRQTSIMISKIVKEEIKIPKITGWLDEYSGETLVKEGEFTIFTKAVKELFKQKAVSKIMNFGSQIMENIDVIKDVIHTANEANVIASDLTYYLFNAYISKLSIASMPIIIPNSVKIKKDGMTLIKRELLSQTLRDLETVLGQVRDIKDFQNITQIINILKSDAKEAITRNQIFNLTFANQLVKMATAHGSTFAISLPEVAKFDATNEYQVDVAEEFFYKEMELDKFVDALLTIDIESFISGGNTDIITSFLALNDLEFNTLVNSRIIRLTITEQINSFSKSITSDTLILIINYRDLRIINPLEFKDSKDKEKYITKDELLYLKNAINVLRDETSQNIFSIKKLFDNYEENVKTVFKSNILKPSLALTLINGINKAAATDSDLGLLKDMHITIPQNPYDLIDEFDKYKPFIKKLAIYTQEKITMETIIGGEKIYANELKNILDFVNAFGLIDLLDTGDFSKVKEKISLDSIIINKNDTEIEKQQKERNKQIITKSAYLTTILSKIIKKMPGLNIPVFYTNNIEYESEILPKGITVEANFLDSYLKNPFTSRTKETSGGLEVKEIGEIERIIDSLNKLELTPDLITAGDINFTPFDVIERIANLQEQDITSAIIRETIGQKLLEFSPTTEFKLYFTHDVIKQTDEDIVNFYMKDLFDPRDKAEDIVAKNYQKLHIDLNKHKYISIDELINLAKAFLLLTDGKEFKQENILISNIITPSEGTPELEKDKNVKDKLKTVTNSKIMRMSFTLYMKATIQKSEEQSKQYDITKLVLAKELNFENPVSNILTELETNNISLNWLDNTETFNIEQSKDEFRKFLYGLYKLKITNIDGNNTFKLDITSIVGSENEDVRNAVKDSTVLALTFYDILNSNPATKQYLKDATDLEQVLNKEIPYANSTANKVFADIIGRIVI